MRDNHHEQILCGSGWQDAGGEDTREDRVLFEDEVLFEPMTKYNNKNKLDVGWQCGLFTGVATRTNEEDGKKIMHVPSVQIQVGKKSSYKCKNVKQSSSSSFKFQGSSFKFHVKM